MKYEVGIYLRLKLLFYLLEYNVDSLVYGIGLDAAAGRFDMTSAAELGADDRHVNV